METITIKYDGRNTAIKKAIELIVELGGSVVSTNKKAEKEEPNVTTLKAFKEAENGEVNYYKDVDDLMKHLYEL